MNALRMNWLSQIHMRAQEIEVLKPDLSGSSGEVIFKQDLDKRSGGAMIRPDQSECFEDEVLKPNLDNRSGDVVFKPILANYELKRLMEIDSKRKDPEIQDVSEFKLEECNKKQENIQDGFMDAKLKVLIL